MERVTIQSVQKITHDVLQIRADKPGNLQFKPGQAVDLSIDKPGWEKELRPFTFTSLPEDDHIEFTIKTYPDHHGVTGQLLSLVPKDGLLLHEVFGDIHYKGPGIFLAGGAGVTPFIAIFKYLEKEGKIGENKLIFANKTSADIILEDTFRDLLGANFINILSQQQTEAYEHGYITAALIQQHADENIRYYYLCGPDAMMESVEAELTKLGIAASAIVKEAF
ncbi:hypothetical protein GCM10027051_08520 [Niabella terrae]